MTITSAQAASLSPEQYQAFCRFLEETSGIVLGANKQYLVVSRLSPLLAAHRCASLEELLDRITRPGATALRAEVVEAMTTNETQFFRDTYPFEMLKKHLFPELERRQVRLARLWSAGCSTGQEAYSVLMTAHEYNREGGRLEVEVVGTDISPSVIRQAAAGRYSTASISRGLSQQRLQTFFTKVNANCWEILPELRRRAAFRVHNLLESYALLGRFDLIFCRNVLIYFSQEARYDILTRMAGALNPGGYLLLGGSEALHRGVTAFELLRTPYGIIYRRRDRA